MSQECEIPIAVIGGGAAGVMAALRAALNNDQFYFFPGSPKNKKKSRTFWVRKVENMPGFFDYKRAIEEPNFGALNWIANSDFKDNFHWVKNTGIESIKKCDDELFQITDSKGETYLVNYVVLCTGGMDLQPEIGGSIQPILPFSNAQTVDYCIRCDGHHVYKKDTVVIGTNNDAAWVCSILHERYQPPNMTLITHGEKIEFDETMQKLLPAYNIKVINEKVVDVLGDPKAGILEGFQLENGETIKAQMAFVSLGMIYYNDLATNLGVETDSSGCLKTDPKGQTSISNLYVAGDLRSGIKNQIYTAWDSAVDSLDHINSKIRAIRREKILQ